MDQLDNALICTQKLEKKLRLLLNRGEATSEQLLLAKDAVAACREIARLRGEKPIDIDSRGQRDR